MDAFVNETGFPRIIRSGETLFGAFTLSQEKVNQIGPKSIQYDHTYS